MAQDNKKLLEAEPVICPKGTTDDILADTIWVAMKMTPSRCHRTRNGHYLL